MVARNTRVKTIRVDLLFEEVFDTEENRGISPEIEYQIASHLDRLQKTNRWLYGQWIRNALQTYWALQNAGALPDRVNGQSPIPANESSKKAVSIAADGGNDEAEQTKSSQIPAEVSVAARGEPASEPVPNQVVTDNSASLQTGNREEVARPAPPKPKGGLSFLSGACLTPDI